MYSNIALKIFAALCEGKINSRTMFWKSFADQKIFENLEIDFQKYINILKSADYNLVRYFDENFPIIEPNIKPADRPFLFAYKGDISLLSHVQKNIAVVGVLTAVQNIEQREQKLFADLVAKKV